MIKLTKDNFVRNLARGRLLVPYLEKYSEWDQPFDFKYEPKEGDTAWHPSGDCLPTPRQLYDQALRIERESHSPSLQRTFLVGHFWHQAIQEVLQRMEFAAPEAVERKGQRVWAEGVYEPVDIMRPGKLLHEKYPLPYHWARGAGDVAPLVLPGGWEGILDIKTMRGGDFDRALKTGKLPERFAKKYEAQINIYMDFFDQEHGMFLAVNKDSPHNFCEFVYDRNDDMIETIYSKWQYVSECLDEGKRPEDDNEDFDLPFTGPVG